MASPPSSKKQRTHPAYELLYHPGIPGRGEFIRLPLEAAGAPYTDVANEEKNGYSRVQKICMNDGTESDAGNPPVFAPPALRVKDGDKVLVISQTANILNYLGERIGMAGEEEDHKWLAAEVAMTALDLNNEIHDSHHPIAVAQYYEDQQDEAKKKSKDVRENRLPKFFSYFQRTLQHNKAQGNGKYMVGSSLSYADTTVWQVLDGLMFAFPKEMQSRKKEFAELLDTFYESVKAEKAIAQYLKSGKRKEYRGVFRYYPELDRQG